MIFHEETYSFSLKSFQYVCLSMKLFSSIWGKDHCKQMSMPMAWERLTSDIVSYWHHLESDCFFCLFSTVKIYIKQQGKS